MDLQEAFDAGFDAVKTYVDRSLEAFDARLVAVEAKSPEKGDRGEKGADGKSVSVDELAPIVDRAVDAAVASIPVPKDGADGRDGQDGAPGTNGQSITIADIEPLIIRAVETSVAAIPVPKDGMDGVHGKDGAPGIDGRDGKDGLSLAGALIDRSGVLVVTLSNGTTCELGPVIGKDGAPGPAGSDGKDGVDGLGFDDMDEEILEDGRTIIRRYRRGEQVKEFRHTFPVIIDRGVYRDGNAYKTGDAVTWAGSLWVAQKDTACKPDTGEDWRLSVKRGRDGKSVT